MPTALFTWELGLGLGHLVSLRSLAEPLLQRGHQVVLALRDLSRVASVFGQSKVRYLQAPVATNGGGAPIITYAHVLHQCGFGDLKGLYQRVQQWRAIFNRIQPDLIIFEQSPTALLASRGLGVRRLVMGTGFACPPDVEPLPSVRPWIDFDGDWHRRHEANVLAAANRVLRELAAPPLDRLAQLYHQADDMILDTIEPLDPFRAMRNHPCYFGTQAPPPAPRFEWPDYPGPRLFGYLYATPELPQLLHLLDARGHPSVLHVTRLPTTMYERYSAGPVLLSPHPVDVAQACRECDAGILAGTLNTTAQMLLAGKPTLHMPFTLENRLTVEALHHYGAALAAHPGSNTPLDRLVDTVLGDSAIRESARRLAEANAYDKRRLLVARLQRVLELLP